MRLGNERLNKLDDSPLRRILSFLKDHLLVVALIVVLAIAGIFIYAYIDTKSQLVKLADPKVAGTEESKDLVAQIGRYIELPQETPTLATVSDVDKLKSQEFFKNAQNGDKVLIFAEAGKAVLYRPSTSKVIEYSKVNLNDSPNN